MSDVILPANEQALDALLSSDGTPLLVDFFATWCGPCSGMAPALASPSGLGQ